MKRWRTGNWQGKIEVLTEKSAWRHSDQQRPHINCLWTVPTYTVRSHCPTTPEWWETKIIFSILCNFCTEMKAHNSSVKKGFTDWIYFAIKCKKLCCYTTTVLLFHYKIIKRSVRVLKHSPWAPSKLASNTAECRYYESVLLTTSLQALYISVGFGERA